MLKFSAVLTVLLVLRGFGQVGERLFQIADGGQIRSFVVACDELQCRPGNGGASHPVLTGDQETVAGIVARATDLEQGSKNVFDLVLYEAGKERGLSTRRVATRQILVSGGEEVVGFAKEKGAKIEVPEFAPGFKILTFPGAGDSLRAFRELRELPGMISAQPMLAKTRWKRFIPNDPRFAYSQGNRRYQWHLRNTGQNGGTAGIDVNVVSVWDRFRGQGIKIGIVDDGLETGHPDLLENVDVTIDHNWNSGSPNDPNPNDSLQDHGTGCAGVAAARGNNSKGVSGVAPEATLVGLRLIAEDVSDLEEAEAVSWRNDAIQIKSNSWGPDDHGDLLEDAGPLTRAALAESVASGRGGRGTIFVWAGGNGGGSDNVNYDGYANSIYTIAVGATDDEGGQASYSEPGTAKVISAPSTGDFSSQGIVTTTLVENGTYRDDFGGTSSATPLVSGVVALMLEANPNLGWRDVQEILMVSARQVNPTDPGWHVNGGGLYFHHGLGAGLLDAAAAVAKAETWENLAEQLSISLEQVALARAIPDNLESGTEVVFDFANADPLRVEHVNVTVEIAHEDRGDLAITLISPSGTESRLTERHLDLNADYANWRLMSVHHWGENSSGLWRLRVSDLTQGTAGVVDAVSIELFGTDLAEVTEAPEFTSAATLRGNVGRALSYQVSAKNRPDSYAVAGLPEGLSFDESSHLIFGTPTAERAGTVILSATNAIGTTNFNLTLEIGPRIPTPPALESNLASTAVLGQPFQYLIPATNSPTSYRADSLPQWLTLNDATGRLSGVPTIPGNLSFSVTATNSDGSATASLFIEIIDPNLDPLARALDTTSFVFSQSGDAGWGVQSGVVQAGTEALQSGLISDSEDVTLSTNVTGPGVLRFFWKVSSEEGYDELTASIDGEIALAISGEVDWEQGGLAIPPGNHLVSWSYRKDVSDGAGDDTAWLDQLTFTAGDPFRTFEESIDYYRLGWEGRDGWTGQTVVTHDGVDALSSPPASNNDRRTLSTTVTGPGTVSFFWKASTEEGFDVFRFSANGTLISEISGQQDWLSVTYHVPAGETLLQWSYRKDGATSSGADRVWLDELLWRPAGAGDLDIWQAQNLPPESALVDDLDLDGRSNLLEYALGTDPWKAGLENEPVFISNPEENTYTYQADLSKTGITYRVGVSFDLRNWSPIPDSVVSVAGTLETRQVGIPVSTEKRFLRLEILLNP